MHAWQPKRGVHMQAATCIDLNKHKLRSAVSAGHSECSNHANQMGPIMAEWPPVALSRGRMPRMLFALLRARGAHWNRST
jgi:hypothetical protein